MLTEEQHEQWKVVEVQSYPTGCKAQLDYILVNRKWRKSVKDCQTYDSFSTVYSDHKIVSTKLCLSLRANGKPTAKRTNFDLREAYNVEVKDCFETVYELEEKHTLNDLYTPDVVVMANRRKRDRLLKSVQVRPK